MKVTKLVSFLFFIALCISSYANSRKLYKDSLHLTGKIYNNNSQVRKVIINIYHGNKKWKTIHVKSSNQFRTNLPLNGFMTVEITAENYHTKRFIIDSTVPKMPKSPLKYDFDIDIFQESELDGINPSFLDFPVGLVTYNEKKKEFHRNKGYTKDMKKAYLKLWAEAQEAERQAEGLE